MTFRETAISGWPPPQVVSLWAFNPLDAFEYLSLSHTRSRVSKARLLLRGTAADSCEQVFTDGRETFVSTRRKPMLTLIGDTSPGVHDTMMPACARFPDPRSSA